MYTPQDYGALPLRVALGVMFLTTVCSRCLSSRCPARCSS